MNKIALIAHDNMKDDIVAFAKKHADFFKNYELVATGTTGKKIMEATGLNNLDLLVETNKSVLK